MIVETFRVTADTTDLLSTGTRLKTIPYDGELIVEFQAHENSATNNYTVTMQLPDGSTPLEDVTIPAGATAGAINDNDKYVVAFPISGGGGVVIACDETGTTVMDVRVTLMP